MESGLDFFGELEEHISEAYERYTEVFPAENDFEPEVELKEYYPEMKTAFYRCSVDDRKTEFWVAAEENEERLLASFITGELASETQYLNILELLEDISEPKKRLGERGETFVYSLS